MTIKLNERGLLTLDAMHIESSMWTPEATATIFDMPIGTKVTTDRRADPKVVTELLNLGWRIFKLIDPEGAEMWAMTTEDRLRYGPTAGSA